MNRACFFKNITERKRSHERSKLKLHEQNQYASCIYLLKNNFVRMNKRYLFFIIILPLLFLGACEKNEYVDHTQAADGARICFFNLSPDAPELNLYFDDTRVTAQKSTVTGVLGGLPYKTCYPGAISTPPTSYIGLEYFTATPGQTVITIKDTAYVTGFTTYASTGYNFEDSKYYSVFAMDVTSSMSCVIVEDDIVSFTTTGKVKIRGVNAISGVTGDKVDLWLIHQPATGVAPIAPYKLAGGLDFKGATSFADTISAGNYKWTVTVADAVPTSVTAPTDATGSPYTLRFSSADVIVAQGSSTTLEEKTTYSFLLYGIVGSTSKAPSGNVFRNRRL